MKKIYIIGIVGAGKTTVSRALSNRLSIPHYEVDAIVHKETDKGRIKQSEDEQIAEFIRIDEMGSWIIEGTYRPSCKYLLENSDTIIFLDPSLYVRRFRIIKRFIKQKFGIEKSHYRSDLKMLKAMFKWTNDFEYHRTDFEEMIRAYEEKVVVIKTKSELKRILQVAVF